jgi:hypothetical protein
MLLVVNEPEEQTFSLKNQNFSRFWDLVGAVWNFLQFPGLFGWPTVKTNEKTRKRSSKHLSGDERA